MRNHLKNASLFLFPFQNPSMENLELNIFDLVSKDVILAHRESQDAFTDQTQDLRFGIDYDFIVESFFCEYKLDTKLLKTIQIQYSTSTDPIEKAELENQFAAFYAFRVRSIYSG